MDKNTYEWWYRGNVIKIEERLYKNVLLSIAKKFNKNLDSGKNAFNFKLRN